MIGYGLDGKLPAGGFRNMARDVAVAAEAGPQCGKYKGLVAAEFRRGGPCGPTHFERTIDGI
jgi:hypothetical protein